MIETEEKLRAKFGEVHRNWQRFAKGLTRA